MAVPAAPDPRRTIPSVERVVAALSGAPLPHPLLVACAREAVDAARDRATGGVAVDEASVVEDARARVGALERSLLSRVVNATGVLLHTNLGRAPIDHGSLAGAIPAVTAYSNLEFEMDEGQRGSRHEHAGALLARAVGAEAGIVVNNNAAAVLLVLAALARGRDVIVSRGELVEIGGGFRVPDVMAESGARLVEVGTTNRTRRRDYAAAIGPETAALLKVHASNYRMVGFVEAAPISALADLGPPVIFDAGSGLLDERVPWVPGGRPAWLEGEPGVRQAVADGASIVTFSGDKLLGGPQAGVIVGRADLVASVAHHPLARAVRADKLTLAVLQGVALTYLTGEAGRLPLWRMVAVPLDDLVDRATRLALLAPEIEVVHTEAVVGGGSLPGRTLPSAGISVREQSGQPGRLAALLRQHGVVARIEQDLVVCDLRAVDPSDDASLGAAVTSALRAVGA